MAPQAQARIAQVLCRDELLASCAVGQKYEMVGPEALGLSFRNSGTKLAGATALRLKFQEILTILEEHKQLEPLFAAFDITGVKRGQKTKDVRARLGDEEERIDGRHTLPTVTEAKEDHALRMTPMLEKHIREAEARHTMRKASLVSRRNETLLRQRAERAKLDQEHEARRIRETQDGKHGFGQAGATCGTA